MATRGLLFFMTPMECEDTICKIASSLSLCVTLENFWREARVETRSNAESLRFDGSTLAQRVWFSREPPPIRIYDVKPTRLGSVMLYPSRVEGDVLLMADLGAKSEWLDPSEGRFLQDPDSIPMFNKFAVRIKKHLPFFARNRWSGDLGWRYTKVRHSAGVVDWVGTGGKINQFGVANIEYTIDEVAKHQNTKPQRG